jgi:hypothetical protein
MCFDADSSILAWTISYAAAYYLFYRNRRYDRWNAAFIIVFSTIQILEAGVWSTKNQDINELLTKLILLALLLQPLAQTYFGYRYTSSNILFVGTIVFFVLLCWGLWQVYSKPDGTFNTTVGQNGHLSWNNGTSKNFFGSGTVLALYLLGIMVPLLFMKDMAGLPLLAIGILTALYSGIVSHPKEFGSYWCYTAVAYSLVALFV